MKSISIKDIEFNVEEKGYENFWSNIESWEVKNLEFIKSNFCEDQIFIDVGSWIGPYTIFAAKLGMKVYSYEPDNIAYRILKHNISLNKFKHDPEIFNYGLSNIIGKRNLYSNSDTFAKSESSLINYKNKDKTKKITIEINDFLKEMKHINNLNHKSKINILKIDIEGGEFSFENDIYNFVNKNNIYCLMSYHYFVFNSNKLLKNYHKLKTFFLKLLLNKNSKKKFLHF